MSDSAMVPPMIRQGQILQQTVMDIVKEVDAPWTHITYLSKQTAPWGQSGTYVTRPGRNAVLEFHPDSVDDLVAELREVMYQFSTGTWFSMWIEIDENGRVSSRFDYDNEPEWTRPADPLVYYEDLQKYPRDPEHIPPWLAEQVALGKADFDRHHYPDGTPRR